MSTVSEIEKSISKLSNSDLNQLREWFYNFDNEKWDTKIEKNINSGILKKISDKSLVDFAKGDFKQI